MKLELETRIVVENPYTKEIVTKMVCKNFGEEIGFMSPTFFPANGKFGLNIFKPTRKNPHSNECIDFINSNTLFFPNAHGLILLEHFDKIFNFLPTQTWTFGLDHIHHLYFEKNSGHRFAFLRKTEKGYEYNFYPYYFIVDHDERILAFDINQ